MFERTEVQYAGWRVALEVFWVVFGGVKVLHV